MHYNIIKFNTFCEEDGKITIIDENIPFIIKRIFAIYDVPKTNIIRGNHASENSYFLFQAVSGSVCIELIDVKEHITLKLDNPNYGVYVHPMIWIRTRLSENAILQVYASETYKDCKYINDYSEYLTRCYN